MKKLDLTNRTARVVHMNSTTEKRGDNDVPMVDLSLRTAIQPDDIVRLASVNYTQAAADRWKGMLFGSPARDLGGELARFHEHNITGLTFQTEFEHHTLTLNAPVKRMKFDDVKFGKFAVEFDYEDHTLILHFQARFAPNDLADELMATIKRTVTFSIEPPSEKQLKLLEKEAAKIADKGNAGDADTAETAAEKGKQAAKVGRAFKDALEHELANPSEVFVFSPTREAEPEPFMTLRQCD